MITMSMPPLATGWRQRLSRRPRVAAVFSYRYDAHLVPDLLSNLQPIVDGWIAYDDRAGTGLFTDEAARRRALIGAARAAGADWILAVDPDERFETGTAAAIGRLMRKRGRVAWGFRFRELYAADRYRVDGLWGEKRRYCLFSVFPEHERTGTGLHDTWFPKDGGFRLLHCELELYHLKMIASARRTARRDLYARLDPGRRDQAIGYDYLADETGARFAEIAPGRGYQPPHNDDGGLWMADLAASGD